MKILGFSMTTIVFLVFVFWAGTKFPNAFSRVPVLG